MAYTGTTAVLPNATIASSPTLPNGLTASAIQEESNNRVKITITANDGATFSDTGVIGLVVSSPIDTTMQINWTVVKNGANGTPGTPGYNNAPIILYKADATTPSMPTGTLVYTFSTHTIQAGENSNLNGWSLTTPSLQSNEFLWMISASASSTSDTDTITANEFTSTPIRLDGTNGTNGYNQATLFLYQRASSSSEPTLPTNISYTFSTQNYTGNLLSWSTSIPTTANNYPCWVTSATVVSRSDTVTNVTFSTPVI